MGQSFITYCDENVQNYNRITFHFKKFIPFVSDDIFQIAFFLDKTMDYNQYIDLIYKIIYPFMR